MPIWKAALLGLVQGLTEFLPVSSSGHLKLLETIFGMPVDEMLSFDILLHVATLLAMLIYFREDLLAIFGGFVASLPRMLRRDGWRAVEGNPPVKVGWLVMFTLLPTGVLALLLGDWVEQASAQMVCGFLLVTGGLNLLSHRRMQQGETGREVSSLSVREALWCGLAQGLALFPGVSRSGTTLAAGLGCGLSREAAPRWAFLMAIPAIAAAAVKELPHLGQGLPLSFAAGTVGFLVAFGSGYWAMRTIFSTVRRGRLVGFAWYCWIAGGLGLILSLGR